MRGFGGEVFRDKSCIMISVKDGARTVADAMDLLRFI